MMHVNVVRDVVISFLLGAVGAAVVIRIWLGRRFR